MALPEFKFFEKVEKVMSGILPRLNKMTVSIRLDSVTMTENLEKINSSSFKKSFLKKRENKTTVL